MSIALPNPNQKISTKISHRARSRFASRRSDYFLRRYREEVIRKRKAAEQIEAELAALETELRGQSSSASHSFEPQTESMAAD
jgi:hypothetical protein